MAEQPGLSDRYRRASPWPLFVALGLVLSELGVLFGLFSVAVGGLLLFGGSVAGIVQEAGYVDRPWGLLAGLGAALVLLGALVVGTQLVPSSAGRVAALIAEPNGVAARGLAVAVAGVILLAAGAAGRLVARGPA